MIEKIIDVEIDGHVITGEIIKEDSEAVYLDTDTGIKKIFRQDLPQENGKILLMSNSMKLVFDLSFWKVQSVKIGLSFISPIQEDLITLYMIVKDDKIHIEKFGTYS